MDEEVHIQKHHFILGFIPVWSANQCPDVGKAFLKIENVLYHHTKSAIESFYQSITFLILHCDVIEGEQIQIFQYLHVLIRVFGLWILENSYQFRLKVIDFLVSVLELSQEFVFNNH